MGVNLGQLAAKIAGMAAVLGFVVALNLRLLRYNPHLLAERLTGIGRPDQKTWDKVFLALTSVAFFAWLTVMALDAVRFRWSQVPPWLQGVGAFLLLASFYLFYRTFRENAYLSPAVSGKFGKRAKIIPREKDFFLPLKSRV